MKSQMLVNKGGGGQENEIGLQEAQKDNEKIQSLLAEANKRED